MPRNRQEYDKQYYIKNRERILQNKKNDKWNDKLKHAKQRAKDKDLEFNLTREFLDSICVKYCPILGFELSYNNSNVKNNSATLDRIDNSKGYTVDNVQILSHQANRMKSDSSKQELLAFARYILENYGGDE